MPRTVRAPGASSQRKREALPRAMTLSSGPQRPLAMTTQTARGLRGISLANLRTLEVFIYLFCFGLPLWTHQKGWNKTSQPTEPPGIKPETKNNESFVIGYVHWANRPNQFVLC